MFIPGASTSAVQTRSSTSSCRDSSYRFLCLYQVIGDFLFIPVRSELFTLVAVVWGALLGPKHSRGAIPGPFVGLAPGRARSTRLGESWTASFPRWFRLRDVQHRGRPFRMAQGSSFRRGSVDHKPLVRTSGTGAGRSNLAYILQRPSLLFWDQSIVQAQQAIQRRICGWVAGEQVRRGQIRRRCLYDGW